MKTVLLIFSAVFFISCATTKKTTVASETNTSAAIVTDRVITHNINTLIDTTKFTDAEILYTKVEFYAPAADSLINEPLRSDTILHVKNVETLHIKYSTENKGISQKTETHADSIKQNAVFTESQKLDATTEQKAKNWLKYPMWISICITIITAMIYAYKFLNKIKK
ncbi:MAG: hypothetical protein LBF04_02340 [Prevotellaceae bacterium]|jgi:nicotinamidase-related amidase|nr:hypothetical protein [Prevotellaceae bacterium]